MTGEALYARFTKACVKEGWGSHDTVLPAPGDIQPPVAWPFLTLRDRRVWNDLAKRCTPRCRRATA